MNTRQWNVNQSAAISMQENAFHAFENAVRKMEAILSRPWCVKGGRWGRARPQHTRA